MVDRWLRFRRPTRRREVHSQPLTAGRSHQSRRHCAALIPSDRLRGLEHWFSGLAHGTDAARVGCRFVESEARVCSRCGRRADESRYCPRCGLNLARQRELPTSSQWRSRRSRRVRTAGLRAGVAVVVAALVLVAGYLVGGAIGDNSEGLRMVAESGYREGFDKGRRRGYRATYKSARRRAEREAAEAQAAAPAPPAPEAQATPTTPDPPSDESAEPSSEEEGDSSAREACIYGDGLCTPEENARENEAEGICGGGGPEAEARPDLCGPG